ncbi:MAG: hypothetical protein K0R73_1079 [Candidatus Midichloriaceae bacterium]|jgi:hypothetical protein|nr:hypothetical protein [Candidatus Midichloriaceae bacterium]
MTLLCELSYKGHSLNESFNQNFSEAQRLEEQSRTYFDTARSFSEQAQLMRTQGMAFSHDRMPEFIEYAKAQKDLNGQPLGERALSIIANNPGASERLKESFVRDTHERISNSYRQNAGSSDLRNQYSEAANNINDNVGTFDSSSARLQFEESTHDKHVDNSNLRVGAEDSIKSRRNEINQAHIDKGELESEIKDKLKRDASATMLNSGLEFIGVTNSEIPKTNFNKEGEN